MNLPMNKIKKNINPQITEYNQNLNNLISQKEKFPLLEPLVISVL